MKTRIKAYTNDYYKWLARDNLSYKHNLFMSDFIINMIKKVSNL